MAEQTKSKQRTVTLTTQMQVPISRGTIEYIAGISPEETWSPLTGENVDDEAIIELRKRHNEIIAMAESGEEFSEKLKNFMDESVKLFQAVMSGDKDTIRPYTTGKKFHFILGMPRTGGTTIYNAMSDAYGWPWHRLLLSMTHNYLPNAAFVQQNPYNEYDMGWRLPWNFNNVVFELCQFLVYVNRETPDSEDVFLKSTPLSYAVKLLNFLFGEQADYIVTVRHPGAVTLTQNNTDGKVITREHHIDTMTMWANLYSSIIRECRPLGNVTVVEYGEGMTDFLNEVFEKRKSGTRLETTNFFEYDEYDKDFYASEAVQNIMKYVKDSWALFDLEFPLPEKCI